MKEFGTPQASKLHKHMHTTCERDACLIPDPLTARRAWAATATAATTATATSAPTLPASRAVEGTGNRSTARVGGVAVALRTGAPSHPGASFGGLSRWLDHSTHIRRVEIRKEAAAGRAVRRRPVAAVEVCGTEVGVCVGKWRGRILL